MLLVPFLVGSLLAGPTWVHLPLLVAWLGGYLLSYYLFLALKTRRLGRVRPQVLLYGAVTVPAALVVLAVRPGLLAFAPAYAALLGVNAWFAWRRSERSLANDVAAVLLACLMVPVAAAAADVAPSAVLGASVVVLLYFLGTVLYVKTMIRERGDVRYVRASIVYHAVVIAPAAWASWWFVPLFAWLLVRAASWPGRDLTPKQVGLVEIGHCTVLVVLALVAT